MRNPQDFMNAAYNIGYTFNWFYTDNKNIAYFNSGLNPVRAANTDPLFPSWASDAWKGFHPAAQIDAGERDRAADPESAHPQAVNQPYLTSWNNKQAPGYNDAATGQEYASVYRSQLLDNNINSELAASGNKMTLADLINAMGDRRDPGPARRRGAALRAPDHRPSDRSDARDRGQRATGVGGERRAPHQPRAWRAPSGDYDQTDAVRIMDAWWPLLVGAEFGPTLGSSLLGQVESDFPINDEPGHGVSGAHLGSAFDVGFYGIVQKDLRSVLGEQGRRPAESRCTAAAARSPKCRAALESSLLQAAQESPDQVYPADNVCSAGDQMCSDSIQFRPIGVISQPLIEWVNRPTFQQADEIVGHRP